MPYDTENDELFLECEELRDEIDTIIEGIADGECCGECISTAKSLWRILEEHAREEDAVDMLERFAYKTGVSLNDD